MNFVQAERVVGVMPPYRLSGKLIARRYTCQPIQSSPHQIAKFSVWLGRLCVHNPTVLHLRIGKVRTRCSGIAPPLILRDRD